MPDLMFRITRPSQKLFAERARRREDLTRLRILIADKDDQTRRMLTRLLKSQGFFVVGQAESGAETLALVDKLQPHLLLLGSTLAGRTGLEVLRRVKHSHPAIGVTVLADMQDFGVLGKLLEHGAGAVLATPVDGPALVAELRKAGDRCIAALATRSILAFRVPESERYVRALPSQCDYPAGPQLVSPELAELA